MLILAIEIHSSKLYRKLEFYVPENYSVTWIPKVMGLGKGVTPFI